MTRRNGLALLVIAFTLLAASRFWALGADPPGWMPGAWLVDSGWWASGARGAVLFDNPHSEDFGMAAFMVPGYTWMLTAMYRFLGVDLLWAQALAAISNVLTIAMVGVLLWRKAGRGAAMWAMLLLAASPFYWAHGRAALPESPQACLIILGLALWMVGERRLIWALLSGMAMGAAIVVKFNAATLGILPLILGAALVWACVPASRAQLSARSLVAWTVGLAAVGLFAFAVVVVPHWDEFWTTFRTESRTGEVDWARRMTFPGYIVISDGMARADRIEPVLWRVARWSPAILWGLWLYLLHAVMEWRAQGLAALRARGILELTVAAWAMLAWGAIMLGLNQWEYRFIGLLPAFAMLAAFHLSRSETLQTGESPRGGIVGAWILWIVLLLPVLVLFKPAATRWAMALTRHWQLGGENGLGLGAAGTPLVAAWLVLMLLLAPWHRTADQIARCLRPAWTRRALAGMVLVEAGLVAGWLISAEFTLRRGLPELQAQVAAGETVAGRLSATLFHQSPVHTVRSASREDDPDNFAWDAVYERYHPRYVIMVQGAGGGGDTDFTAGVEDLRQRGYAESRRLAVGPYDSGSPRYHFVLYAR